MTYLVAEVGEVIDNAIFNEEVICFWYAKSQLFGEELRVLSPYEASEDGETILGYDHARCALRRFELSKIVGLEPPPDEEYVKPIEKEEPCSES